MSALPHISTEGLAFKSLQDVQEPIDFRLNNAPRPSAETLDENLSRQLSGFIHHEGTKGDTEKQSFAESEPVYVCASLGAHFRTSADL